MNNQILKLKSKGRVVVNGYALPQILILGVGLAIGISGLITSSMVGILGSRISRHELIAKASADSGITSIKNLLNDGGENLLYYFWLAKSCSKSSSISPTNISKGVIPNPPKLWWQDNEWCKGSKNCLGRQKGPMCNFDRRINWNRNRRYFSMLIDGLGDRINNISISSNVEFKQTFDIKSTDYTGTEDQGVNSILIEGRSETKQNGDFTSSNKLRVNIQVNKITPLSGFGFIAVGEEERDGLDSLFLGNLKVKGDKKGSIIWRRNLYSQNECGHSIQNARGFGSKLPKHCDGGIWIQPIGMPSKPVLKNIVDKKIVICTSEISRLDNRACEYTKTVGRDRYYRIHSLIVKGKDALFTISTTDSSKATLEIMGDLDISNGGSFCHKNGSEQCGSGNRKTLQYSSHKTKETKII